MDIGSNAENKMKEVFTPNQVAEYLKISKVTVYRLAYKRDLICHRIGGQLRFKKNDVEKYFEANRI
jgi:excisionase family DNA binding protein